MRVDRRRFLSVIGATTASGLAGCTTGSSTDFETKSPTSTGTNTTTGTTAATTESTTTSTGETQELPSSRELYVVSRADNVVSFDQRLVRQSDDSTVYRDTYTYDPGESLTLGENFDRGTTYTFEMAIPDGEPVFESTLYPYVARLEVTIRSSTSVERTGITEI